MRFRGASLEQLFWRTRSSSDAPAAASPASPVASASPASWREGLAARLRTVRESRVLSTKSTKRPDGGSAKLATHSEKREPTTAQSPWGPAQRGGSRCT